VVKLGDHVKDKLTGFEGIAVARAEYLNGCISVSVQSTALHDGIPVEAQWFDEQQLTDKSKATAGGPQSRPPAIHP